MDFNIGTVELLSYVTVAIVTLLVVAATAFVYQFRLFYLMFASIDKSSARNGGQLVAQVLKEHGVKYIFTLCGGHISPILVSCEKLNIRVVDVRHEVTTVFAADAVARLSGVIGVAAVTAGPGVTNTVTAVKNAQMAESPVLVLGGAAGSILKGRGALQDIDQMALLQPICKFCASVKYVRDIVPTLRKAIAVAQSGTPGPVFVELPIDILYHYEIVYKEIGKPSVAKTFMQKVQQFYIQNYINQLFADAWVDRPMGPLPVDVQSASVGQVVSAMQLLRKSKCPVFLLGSQALLPPTTADELRTSLESLGVPCFLAGMSRGLLGRDSPIHIRQQRRDALKEADVVFLIGTVCDFRLNYGRVFNHKSKIVAVNRNREQLTKNSDLLWRATLSFQVDPASFVVALQKTIVEMEYHCDPEWTKKLKDRDAEKEALNKGKAKEQTEIHLNPLSVLHHLEDNLDDNSIVVADGGDFVGSAAYIVRPRRPLAWLDPGAFGTLGVGGGFALGAKLVRPDSDVWVIYGDGALGFSIAEFDTFTRHNLPVIALVGNDACWSQIARAQIAFFNSNVACDLDYLNYHTVAEGYGGKGILLDRSCDDDKIVEQIKAAQKMSREGNSVLINVLIGKTDFREGSISV
ncbi:2-hydroxyacyl-CoA lyase 2-like [Dysidea avara]|uniref:2-hydroxyacyl-CoA lyase 2-like n=1 Tax=Dysidea avara TaxID=196820 RepID=UPI00331E0030